MSEFDPWGPLPSGTTVLQASAGTGKTHTIAALATRYVAEGLATIDQLLIVTFSRDAARELRRRVRDRLQHALAEQGAEQESPARKRLQQAILELDQAMIMTLHEFALAMFSGLGVLAAQDPQARLVEDASPLVREIAHDLYLQRYCHLVEAKPPFPYRDQQRDGELIRSGAFRLSQDALFDATAPLVPSGAVGAAGQRVSFAQDVRREATQRKRALGVFTFDDQLLRLRDSLIDPDTGEASRQRLRQSFAVVLVDEFQDTDPVQWDILRLAFHGHRPLILIGDPKQAIYAFRGADVRSYLAACRVAERTHVLSTNYRADRGLVAALDNLFAGLSVGAGIEVLPVAAVHEPRLFGPDGSPLRAPIRLRTLTERATADRTRKRITDDLVAEVSALLAGDFTMRAAGGAERRPLRPDDIAVLVRRNRRGREITQALRAAGIPVAFSGADSIFSSSSATAWRTLLAALASPRPAEVRAAALTDFFGIGMAELAAAGEDTLGEWTASLRRWDRVLSRGGVAALFAEITAETRFSARVLALRNGERLMTDYRHVMQLLHEATGTIRPTATALLEWLSREMDSSSLAVERTRRLETDAQAVQVKTIHKAKGLQFGVVLLPDLTEQRSPKDEDTRLVFHDADGVRVLDVGGKGAPGRGSRFSQHQQEESEDALRSLYVAFTRAQNLIICWWARTKANTETAPLHRLLFRDRAAGGQPAPGYPLETAPGDGDPADLPWLPGSGIEASPALPQPIRERSLAGAQSTRLQGARFARSVDRDWRRTSYSGLTAEAHADGAWLEIAPEITSDEGSPDADEPHVEEELPMAGLPGGAQFGTLVHAVLESADWSVEPSADLAESARGRLRQSAATVLPRLPLPGVSAPQLADALLPSILTPLGTLTDNRRLVDIASSDRLNELDFELELGDVSTSTLADIAASLARHLPQDDPLAKYAQDLAEPRLAGQTLRGFLTGSIDSVLRVRTSGAPDRFVVVDYKTNRLGSGRLGSADYDQASLAQAMRASHYPLQAILYSVALHRFLTSRLPGYDPSLNLGGVLYLFLRGMTGGEPVPADGARTGVFAWQPPAALVSELSELLSDGPRP
ncbi:MAG: UvrD-helicase domain-containing protein [Micropruina sp.]